MVFDARHFSPEKMQKVNLFSTSELFLDVYCLEPGQKQKAHVHESSSKVYIVLEGHARVTVRAGDRGRGTGTGGAREGRADPRRGEQDIRSSRAPRGHGSASRARVSPEPWRRRREGDLRLALRLAHGAHRGRRRTRQRLAVPVHGRDLWRCRLRRTLRPVRCPLRHSRDHGGVDARTAHPARTRRRLRGRPDARRPVHRVLALLHRVHGRVLLHARRRPGALLRLREPLRWGRRRRSCGPFSTKTLTGVTFWNLTVTAFTFVVIGIVLFFGVRRGIESVSRIAMPLVFLSLLIVIFRSVTLPGAGEGVAFFLLPDLSKVDAQTALAALGQVFFSLSLGGTFFLLYGSYLRDDENIPMTAIATAVGDVTAAMLGGLAILPAVFAMGVEPTSGPSLLFITLSGCLRTHAGRSLRWCALLRSALPRRFSLGSRGHGGARRRPPAVLSGGAAERRSSFSSAVDFFVALPSMASSRFLMWNDLVWGSTMQPVGSALTLLALGWFVSGGKALAEINREAPSASADSGYSGFAGSSPRRSSSSSSTAGGLS